MKQIILLISIIIIHLNGFCQDTLTTFYDSKWKPTDSINAVMYEKGYESNGIWTCKEYNMSNKLQGETYFLTNKKEVPVGTWNYKCIISNRQNFKQYNDEGYKIGEWKSTFENGKIYSIGNYEKDKKEGEWNWYFESGQISAKEIYKNDELVSMAFWNEDGTEVKGDLERVVLPKFPGGDHKLLSFISESTNYPNEAKENGIFGKVVVKFIIDETGQIIDPTIEKSAHILLDQEALRVVNSMPNWIPGKFHNQAAKVNYKLPINFKLDESKKKKSIFGKKFKLKQ